MARKLTEPMKEMLRIMAEGHAVELWAGGLFFYPYYDETKSRVNSNTFEALKTRQLVERTMRPVDRRVHFIIAFYQLTEAGRRAAEGLA